MPYVAVRPKVIAGHRYERGEVVDTSALTLPKLATLVRVGVIVQQDQADQFGFATGFVAPVAPSVPAEAEATDDESDSSMCPLCGGGPFKNVNLHMVKTHEEQG